MREVAEEAADAFSLLALPLRRALTERGFTAPTEPQRKAIPLILQGKNVLLIAPTATGKTEAAVLPVLHNLLLAGERQPGIKIVYITPLRALNRDLLERLEWWCSQLDLRVAVRHGDTEVRERSRQSKSPPDMLITTPETLQAILPGKVMRRHLQSVRWVIVDEVHELATDKRGSQLALGLERLRWIARRDFQLVGLSATIGSPERVAAFLVGVGRPCEIVRVPVARDMRLEILYVKPSKSDYELSARLYTHPEVAGRLKVIRNLIENHQSVLLFTNTRSIAEVLASRFKVWDTDFPVSIHHGSLAKTSRIMAEKGLKGGELRGLVCTSSLELGIDIGSIDLVIQYNSPRQVTRLIQRVGRSGHRIGKIPKGVVITLDSDDTLEAAVIARRALMEELEPAAIPEKPLEALAHQLAGLLTQRPRWHFQEVLELFKRAYPYRELTVQDVADVAAYMHSRFPRLAWVSFEDQILLRPQRAKSLYEYYFDNLSMIPDEKQYLVIDESSDAAVGVLDEAFVAEYGEPGVKFIVRGSPWKIRSIHGDKIYVRSVEDPTGAIPSWVGEEIPVPFEVAMEVGALRRMVEDLLNAGRGAGEIAGRIAAAYPVSRRVAFEAVKETVEQWKMGKPIPTDTRVTLEEWSDYVILQCCFGSLVNKTLSRILGHILAEKVGEVVGVQEDPYRIVIQTHKEVGAEEIRELLLGIRPGEVDGLAVESVVKTGLFKRRIVHVARKFGALAKWADFSTLSLKQLIKSFEGTPIFEEAVKDTLAMDMDVENTREVLGRLRRGEISAVVVSPDAPKKGRRESPATLTPIARIGVERISRKTDLIPPEKLRLILLESTRARLLNEAVTLACLSCWGYIRTSPVKELPAAISCPACGSRQIGVSKETEEELLRLKEKISRGALKGRELRLQEHLTATAKLLARYGSTAALALAGHGLTPEDAEGILARESEPNERFFELVMEAEKEALKRKFM